MSTLGTRMLIDGELVTAGAGRTFDNVNPATEEVIGVAPDADAADVERAIGAARRPSTPPDWSTNVELRRRCLVQLRDALRAERRDPLRPLLVAEVGAARSC